MSVRKGGVPLSSAIAMLNLVRFQRNVFHPTRTPQIIRLNTRCRGVTHDNSATATTTRLEWFSAERNEFSGSCGQCVAVSGWTLLKTLKGWFLFLLIRPWVFFLGEVGTVSTQISAQTVSRNNPTNKKGSPGILDNRWNFSLSLKKKWFANLKSVWGILVRLLMTKFHWQI